jgi:transcriptional regulator with XRE-family HTH domain
MLHVEFARRQKRWSQETLGQLTDIPQAFISLMELGRGIPTPAQAQRLADVLGVTPGILLKRVVVLTNQSAEEAEVAQS